MDSGYIAVYFGVEAPGRSHIAPRGGGPNKDTPGPPPSTNELALGGVDPPPSTNELALGGLDPPPQHERLGAGVASGVGGGWGDFSAPSARLSTTITFHQNITMVLKAKVNFSEW